MLLLLLSWRPPLENHWCGGRQVRGRWEDRCRPQTLRDTAAAQFPRLAMKNSKLPAGVAVRTAGHTSRKNAPATWLF
ncbi:hypothetical protein LEMLEM_LOCUS26199, partial [Lemmus lemmus]